MQNNKIKDVRKNDRVNNVSSLKPTWHKSDLLKITKVTADNVTLEWPPANNNNKNIRYRVLVNSVSVGESFDTTFIVSNLEPGTDYTFSVLAEDEAGNSTEFPRAKKVRTRKGKKEK